MINIALIQKSLPFLLRGAWVSVQIATLSCLIGLVLGTLVGLAQSGHSKLLNFLTNIYVYIIRGTPMLIQITFAYFVLPQLGINFSAFWTAVLVIGLNSSAYISQIVKSGINSVSQGQLEAAHVLGLSKTQITRYIVLPQAFTVVLPALGNELIILLKDSSLASVIGVMELSKEGALIGSRTYDYITIYCAVALVYLLMTTVLSLCVDQLEKRMSRHVKN